MVGNCQQYPVKWWFWCVELEVTAEGVISVSQYVCCCIEIFLPGADCQMLMLWLNGIEVVQCLDGPSIKDDCGV